MSFFNNLPTSDAASEASKLPSDQGFKKRWPAVWEYLTATEYAPGQPRERSSLTLVVEDGCFKYYLSEKTKECGIDATGETQDKALDALEARITSAAPGWRSVGGGRKKKRN